MKYITTFLISINKINFLHEITGYFHDIQSFWLAMSMNQPNIVFSSISRPNRAKFTLKSTNLFYLGTNLNAMTLNFRPKLSQYITQISSKLVQLFLTLACSKKQKKCGNNFNTGRFHFPIINFPTDAYRTRNFSLIDFIFVSN